jgi:hypothetical protein
MHFKIEYIITPILGRIFPSIALTPTLPV